MKEKRSAVFLVGYGGPESRDQIRPFLDHVLAGIPVPKERYEAVVHHYELLDGRSPYKKMTRAQQEALSEWLVEQGMSVPVYCGYRHCEPFYEEVWTELKKQKVEKVIAFILAPFRCYASFEKYIEKMKEAQVAAGAQAIELVYTEAFHIHPLYIEAQAMRIREAVKTIPASELQKTLYLFCAHSIPVSMSDKSAYAEQFTECSFRVADHLKLKNWKICYQSRSGNPRDPWLEPDISAVLENIDRRHFSNVVVIPCGFLCDNVEVLYDLDIEAKNICQSLELVYRRALTVMDHPIFIDLVGHLILEKYSDAI